MQNPSCTITPCSERHFVQSPGVAECGVAEWAENPFRTIAYMLSEHKLSSAIHVAAATLPQGPGWDREEIVR